MLTKILVVYSTVLTTLLAAFKLAFFTAVQRADASRKGNHGDRRAHGDDPPDSAARACGAGRFIDRIGANTSAPERRCAHVFAPTSVDDGASRRPPNRLGELGALSG